MNNALSNISIWIYRIFLCTGILFFFLSYFFINEKPGFLYQFANLQTQEVLKVTHDDQIKLFEKENDLNLHFYYPKQAITQNTVTTVIELFLKQSNQKEIGIHYFIIDGVLKANIHIPNTQQNPSLSKEFEMVKNYQMKIYNSKEHPAQELLQYFIQSTNIKKNSTKIKLLYNYQIISFLSDLYQSLPLSNKTAHINTIEDLILKQISRPLLYLKTLILTIEACLLFLFCLLLTRRSFSVPLLIAMKQNQIEIKYLKSLSFKLTPYLLFPTNNIQDICNRVCFSFKQKLERSLSQKEFQLFKNQASSYIKELETITTYTKIIKQAKNIRKLEPGNYTLQQYQDRIQEIKKLIFTSRFTSSNIKKYNLAHNETSVWESCFQSINNTSIQDFKEHIIEICNSISLKKEQKSIKIDSPEQNEKYTFDFASDKKADNQKIRDDTLNYIYDHHNLSLKNKKILEQASLSEIKTAYLFFSLNTDHLKQNFLDLLKKNEPLHPALILAIKSKNILDIELFFSEKNTSESPEDPSDSPLLQKKVLVLGGDLDQEEKYLQIINKLGAVKTETVIDNHIHLKNALKADYDVYIYIATKISHSLRFLLTNHLKKKKKHQYDLYILNHSRSGFKNALLNSINKWQL